MAHKDIRLLQLTESPFGIRIAPLDDREIAGHPEVDVVTPHRHDHYCCFLVESGRLEFSIDFQCLHIAAPSLLVSCPGQVHGFVSAGELKGWGLVFDARFVDENARHRMEQSFHRAALLALDTEAAAWFGHLLPLMHATLQAPGTDVFRHRLVQTLLNAFFYKAAAIFRLQEDERIREYSPRNLEIVKIFHRLVKKHFTSLRKPSDYAARMNITVGHLNDTVKSVTGFPSTHFIRREIFGEARRLLLYTDKSVKEVAFRLGYEDDKYFIRLFGQTTGTSPARFRKLNKIS